MSRRAVRRPRPVARRRRPGRRHRGAAFGVLNFVVGTLLVANAWGVVDAKLAVTSAAREGVRAYVEAPDGERGGAADDARPEAVAGHGRNPDSTTVEIRHDGDRALRPLHPGHRDGAPPGARHPPAVHRRLRPRLRRGGQPERGRRPLPQRPARGGDVLRRDDWTVPAPAIEVDRGSVLMLMPAAVLIVMVLGAIAVDLTAVRLGQRELDRRGGRRRQRRGDRRARRGGAARAGRATGSTPPGPRSAVLEALGGQGHARRARRAADGHRQRHRHRRGAPRPAGAAHLRQGPSGRARDEFVRATVTARVESTRGA